MTRETKAALRARIATLELEKQSLVEHAGHLLAERAQAVLDFGKARAAVPTSLIRRAPGIPARNGDCTCAPDASWLAEWCPYCERLLAAWVAASEQGAPE